MSGRATRVAHGSGTVPDRLPRAPRMAWSWTIGRIAGIPIYIHWTFLILIGWILVGHLSAGPSLAPAPFWPTPLVVTVFLAVFTLLPAFPVGGGRGPRALLALRLEYGRATRIAASIGQFMAVLFGFLGLSGNPLLLLIALFVWIGA